MVKTVAQVDSARPVVFAALTDFSRYPEWVPGCERCSVLSAAGHTSTTEIVLNSMKKLTLRLRFDATPDQLLRFQLVSGDIKSYSGSYRLMNASDGLGTVVITELELDAGPMAPQFIVDRMVKKTLEETGHALRKYAGIMAARGPAAVVPSLPSASREKRFRRPGCVLRVVRSESGDQIWYGGRVFHPK